jgi:hypothetical protein
MQRSVNIPNAHIERKPAVHHRAPNREQREREPPRAEAPYHERRERAQRADGCRRHLTAGEQAVAGRCEQRSVDARKLHEREGGLPARPEREEHRDDDSGGREFVYGEPLEVERLNQERGEKTRAEDHVAIRRDIVSITARICVKGETDQN